MTFTALDKNLIKMELQLEVLTQRTQFFSLSLYQQHSSWHALLFIQVLDLSYYNNSAVGVLDQLPLGLVVFLAVFLAGKFLFQC